MRIGIPRALYYYDYIELWLEYFKILDIEVVVSKDTDREIIDLGEQYASSEMCLSLKIFLGHVAYLEDKCDYLLLPHIDNYGLKNQMCANYRSLYDLVHNFFDIDILDYEINHDQHKYGKSGLLAVGERLGHTHKVCLAAYKEAFKTYNLKEKQNILTNISKLKSSKMKILCIGHSYNLHDCYIGKTITDLLSKYDCETIYSDYFDSEATNQLSKYLSRELYWKKSKESIGSIILCQEKIDGILFITSFPCGLDSLVNELVMRKIETPYLNLIIDDLDAVAGIETRVESFIDIIKQNKSDFKE